MPRIDPTTQIGPDGRRYPLGAIPESPALSAPGVSAVELRVAELEVRANAAFDAARELAEKQVSIVENGVVEVAGVPAGQVVKSAVAQEGYPAFLYAVHSKAQRILAEHDTGVKIDGLGPSSRTDFVTPRWDVQRNRMIALTADEIFDFRLDLTFVSPSAKPKVKGPVNVRWWLDVGPDTAPAIPDDIDLADLPRSIVENRTVFTGPTFHANGAAIMLRSSHEIDLQVGLFLALRR